MEGSQWCNVSQYLLKVTQYNDDDCDTNTSSNTNTKCNFSQYFLKFTQYKLTWTSHVWSGQQPLVEASSYFEAVENRSFRPHDATLILAHQGEEITRACCPAADDVLCTFPLPIIYRRSLSQPHSLHCSPFTALGQQKARALYNNNKKHSWSFQGPCLSYVR